MLGKAIYLPYDLGTKAVSGAVYLGDKAKDILGSKAVQYGINKLPSALSMPINDTLKLADLGLEGLKVVKSAIELPKKIFK